MTRPQQVTSSQSDFPYQKQLLRLGHLVDALGSGTESLPLGLLAASRTRQEAQASPKFFGEKTFVTCTNFRSFFFFRAFSAFFLFFFGPESFFGNGSVNDASANKVAAGDFSNTLRLLDWQGCPPVFPWHTKKISGVWLLLWLLLLLLDFCYRYKNV